SSAQGAEEVSSLRKKKKKKNWLREREKCFCRERDLRKSTLVEKRRIWQINNVVVVVVVKSSS
ncbi:unnamed protein product, partial [Sphagnum jensenii]